MFLQKKYQTNIQQVLLSGLNVGDKGRIIIFFEGRAEGGQFPPKNFYSRKLLEKKLGKESHGKNRASAFFYPSYMFDLCLPQRSCTT